MKRSWKVSKPSWRESKICGGQSRTSSIIRNWRICWNVNPPAAPWWGGWWERLIGLIKDLLRLNQGYLRALSCKKNRKGEAHFRLKVELSLVADHSKGCCGPWVELIQGRMDGRLARVKSYRWGKFYDRLNNCVPWRYPDVRPKIIAKRNLDSHDRAGWCDLTTSLICKL